MHGAGRVKNLYFDKILKCLFLLKLPFTKSTSICVITQSVAMTQKNI